MVGCLGCVFHMRIWPVGHRSAFTCTVLITPGHTNHCRVTAVWLCSDCMCSCAMGDCGRT